MRFVIAIIAVAIAITAVACEPSPTETEPGSAGTAAAASPTAAPATTDEAPAASATAIDDPKIEAEPSIDPTPGEVPSPTSVDEQTRPDYLAQPPEIFGEVDVAGGPQTVCNMRVSQTEPAEGAPRIVGALLPDSTESPVPGVNIAELSAADIRTSGFVRLGRLRYRLGDADTAVWLDRTFYEGALDDDLPGNAPATFWLSTAGRRSMGLDDRRVELVVDPSGDGGWTAWLVDDGARIPASQSRRTTFAAGDLEVLAVEVDGELSATENEVRLESSSPIPNLHVQLRYTPGR